MPLWDTLVKFFSSEGVAKEIKLDRISEVRDLRQFCCFEGPYQEYFFFSTIEKTSYSGGDLWEDCLEDRIFKDKMGLFQFGGNQDDAEAASDGDFLAKYCDVLEELKSENATKTDDLAKKDSKIESLKDVIEKQSLEIENLTKNQGLMASERAKNEQVVRVFFSEIACDLKS